MINRTEKENDFMKGIIGMPDIKSKQRGGIG